ncbi:hypothetical protein [Sphaerisporangium sp. TRM90804]|uniref:hypothetical protein n=1 Tax=Sphaerisporangium sp. TRM90804 TaxID=3031113 RepID=UPI00244C3030|nr:hypothetical protein [Sphaerisporangium sp. TRM90804]MDH2425781.1 hypothetical protein [Sphaerisporangium sp. TRM90804]
MTVLASNVVAVKQRLFDLIADLPLGDVQVSYGPPANPERDMVYLGGAQGPYAITAMRVGGRVPRTETLSLAVYSVATVPGGTVADAEARAVELGGLIIAAVAGDPTLGDLEGLKRITIAGMELESGADDDAAMAALTLTFEALSHLQ